MRNFDALAVALISMILLGFSDIHLTPQPLLGQTIRIQQTVLRDQLRQQLREQLHQQLRNRIQILKCQNR